LTLTHHPHDEDPKLREVCPHLEVEPLGTWYYHISLNYHTLMILSQIDYASGDEPKTVYEGFTKLKHFHICMVFNS
jgi:hypothetical protein